VCRGQDGRPCSWHVHIFHCSLMYVYVRPSANSLVCKHVCIAHCYLLANKMMMMMMMMYWRIMSCDVMLSSDLINDNYLIIAVVSPMFQQITHIIQRYAQCLLATAYMK